MPKTVAITCTRPRCDDIVTALSTDKIHAYAYPVLSIRHIDTPMPKGQFDAVLITSIHAITDKLPKTIPYIAVGDYTAQRLKAHGHTVLKIGNRGVQDMDLGAYKTILYPCAKTPSHIPMNATPWIVYESVIDTDFKWVPSVDCLAVYSTAAAQALKPYVLPHIHVICLSQSIADIFSGHPAQTLAVCENPNYDKMNLLIKTITRT